MDDKSPVPPKVSAGYQPRTRTETEKHRALWASILASALIDCINVHTKHSNRVNAWRWIHDDEEGPYSFRWTCGHLNLDHVELRSIIADSEDRHTLLKRLRHFRYYST